MAIHSFQVLYIVHSSIKKSYILILIKAVFRICFILMWTRIRIQIRGSTSGNSGSGQIAIFLIFFSIDTILITMFFFAIYEFIIHLYKTKSDFLKKKFFTKMLIFMWVYHDFFATRIRPNDKDPKHWIKETLLWRTDDIIEKILKSISTFCRVILVRLLAGRIQKEIIDYYR